MTLSAAQLLDAWQALIEEVEEGYEWDISEFRNELRARGALEQLRAAAMEERFDGHEELVRRIETLDERFKAATVVSTPFATRAHWWSRRVPPGFELTASPGPAER
jgi:hypothetical protein